MFNFYLEEIRDLFYTMLSDEDKEKFQTIKAHVKRNAKMWNYLIGLSLTIFIIAWFFLFKLSFDNPKLIGFAFMMIVVINFRMIDFEHNYIEWVKFLEKHILCDEISKDCQGLSNEQKTYFLVREYVFQKSSRSLDYSLCEVDLLIDSLFKYKDSNDEFSNKKNRQHRYDEFHYLAIMEEIKLQREDEFSKLFSSRKRTPIFLLIWILIIIPTALILRNVNQVIFDLGLINNIVIWGWGVILIYYSLKWLFYNGSKAETIIRWENYFFTRGWEIFERPNFPFANFTTLNKYATFYFHKVFEENLE